MGDSSRGLRTTGVCVSYGGVQAVHNVSLSVEPGTIVGLIGPNGAGKTSFVDAITGFTAASGEVFLDGRRIDNFKPHRRRLAGLSRTWQSGELFNSMTVEQNLLVSAHPPTWLTLFGDLVGHRFNQQAVVSDVLARVGLEGLEDLLAGSLSLGQQKLVGVGRALMGGATTLLLDEPAAGLDSAESRMFADRVRQIVKEGAAALLIDHDMELVLEVCDKIVVLEFGKVIFEGSPSQTRHDPRVVAAYLGAPGEVAT